MISNITMGDLWQLLLYIDFNIKCKWESRTVLNHTDQTHSDRIKYLDQIFILFDKWKSLHMQNESYSIHNTFPSTHGLKGYYETLQMQVYYTWE